MKHDQCPTRILLLRCVLVPKEIFRIEENRYLPKNGIPVKYVLCHCRWRVSERLVT